MHDNSLAALKEINEDGTKKRRADAIIEIFKQHIYPLTDRTILKKLFPGSDNLNLVRPRITEAIKKGILREVGTVQDFATGKKVRMVTITNNQMDMF